MAKLLRDVAQRSARLMSMVIRVQAALAGAPGHRLQGHRLAAQAGITPREFHKRAARLVAMDHINREKIRADGHSYFWYSLSASQLAIFQHQHALAEARSGTELALVTEVEGLPARLAFLRMLKEKTVFGAHATLDLVIGDYERTIRLRNAASG